MKKMNKEPRANHLILEVNDANCQEYQHGHCGDTSHVVAVLAAAASVLMKFLTEDETVTVMTVVSLDGTLHG